MAPTKRAGKKAAVAAALPGGGKAGGKGGKKGFAKADWADSFKKKGAGVSDMTLLSTISNESINDNLKKRFENAEIYTYIGHVLISVNPFRLLPIYDKDTLRSYRNKNRLEMPPHVFAIAETMYYNMTAYSTNQCVIISGESGAGKTEAAKSIMNYIADVAGSESSSAGITAIKDMVLATNPLLEAFGCAKTLRNNNSSRHGKYLEIEFGAHGEPVGAMITNYLLEKGRIVGQIDDERNFHIFYQFTKSASAQQREAFGVSDPSAYFYTSRAGCLDVPGIDDAKDWRETLAAMNTIGISPAEQEDILRMLAAVLWLGNAQYAENDEGNAYVGDSSVTAFVAYLLEVEEVFVTKALTQRTMETQRGMRRGSVYEVPMNKVQAEAARDALAKAIYNNLFEWIVARINISMKARAPSSTIIGVLDIYGFEIFQNNSFEQLCINYVNERLQQIFIELTLKKEQEEYAAEQIKWTPIKFFNNKIVCDLIDERRPPGVFAAMNDATATAHADSSAADSSFVQRMGMLASNPHFEPRGSKFLIKHYAGDVMYDVAGMTDKNKDALGKDLLELVQSSSNAFVTQQLFTDRVDPNSKKRPPTQGDKIKASANALVEKLMRSQPSYIRTIKPNQNKSPTEYDSPAIMHQIKYLGLQENIRIRRAGFAYRNTFDAMVARFYLLSPATSYAGEYTWQGDSRTACERILKDTGIAKEEWQMGVTKAFIKNPETIFALETMRDKYWHNMAARIQRAWRNYVRYRNECASRIQRAWKANKDNIGYVQLRDYGHQVLAGRKERRRFSLLGSRKFVGDYLDVGGRSAQGELLRSAAGLSSQEQVAFSARAELLVSKLGRSSKPSPRFLILTDKAVYILITQIVQQRSQISVERKINLVTISSVGLTNLRDDWIAINVSNTEEPDPVLSCAFKTEFVVHLLQRTNGGVQVNIGPTITYRKKKDKMATIKAQKDETVRRDDVYKSSTIHVPSGEPGSSQSAPLPKKIAIVRPITKGKLLRPGGPSKPKATPAPRPTPASRPLPAAGRAPAPPPAPPAPAAPASTRPSNGVGAARAPAPPPAPPMPGAGRTTAAAMAPPPKRAAAAAPPPPPPPPPPAPAAPPAAPQKDMWKVLYAFETSEAGEMSLAKDDLVEVVQQDDQGWWLVKKGGSEGWAPSNYLKLVEKPKPVPAPAPAPARRAGPPPAPPAAPTGSTSTSAGARPVQVGLGARSAEVGAAPISVMPGTGHANGLAGILAAKRAAAEAGEVNGASGTSTPASSGRSTPAGGGRAPPAPGPKPPAPGPKPGAPAPPVRPGAPPVPGRAGGGGGGVPGQMDLAAALAKRAGRG